MARTRILVVKDLAVSAMADAAHAARAGYDMLIAVKAMPPKIRPAPASQD
jgi:sugar phosphate isomerase/epimerase